MVLSCEYNLSLIEDDEHSNTPSASSGGYSQIESQLIQERENQKMKLTIHLSQLIQIISQLYQSLNR